MSEGHFFLLLIKAYLQKHLYLSCKKLDWYRDRVVEKEGQENHVKTSWIDFYSHS